MDYQQEWTQCTPAQDSAFETLKPGTYIARIRAVKRLETRETSTVELPPGVSYCLEIVEGTNKGAQVLKEDRFWTVASLRRIKRDILTLKSSIPANIDDLVQSLSASVGQTVEIKITHTQNGDKTYQNIYFNRLCERAIADASDVFGAEIFDDAPPF